MIDAFDLSDFEPIDMTALDGMLYIDAALADQIAAELAAVDVDALKAEMEELSARLGPLDDLPDFDLDALAAELDPEPEVLV